MIFYKDPADTVNVANRKLEEPDRIEMLPQSAYSSDIAPLDYHLFRSMVHFLRDGGGRGGEQV